MKPRTTLMPMALAVFLAASPILAAGNGDAEVATLREALARQQALLAAQQQQLDSLASALEQQAHPSASSATRVGFYGEVHYNAFREPDPVIGKSNFHAHRAVILLSHEFSPDVHFNSEVEFEGAADSSEVETELEQLYVDWKLSQTVSLQLGQFLLPVGVLNESHEPDVFYGVERNPVEERIIPATWWEKGVMFRALPVDGMSLDVAVHNGLRGDVATLGGPDGLRGFRQEFGGARAEDMAYTLRVKYRPAQGLELGMTAQWQDNLNDGTVATDKAGAGLLEVHGDWQSGAYRLRALAARWSIDGATASAIGADRMEGFYLEPSWKPLERVGLFARYNQWNTAAAAAGTQDDKQVNVGVSFWLKPQVVLKADLQGSNQPGGQGDGLNLGVGLSF